MNKVDFSIVKETLWTKVLPNGLTICAIPKPGFAQSFAAFCTNYGGAMRRFTVDGRQVDTPAGVAHFLEHKMFDMPDGTNALGTLSAMGASPNAWTSDSMTAYHFESTSHFEENLRLLLTFVSTPYFTAESVQKEQGIIGQEIRMTEDNPFHAIYYELMKCLYQHSPLRDSVAGTVESIAEITDATLYDCYRAFYAPSNMVLCCAGGQVDPEAVARIAEEVLPGEKAPVPVPDFGMAEGLRPFKTRAEKAMEVSAPQFMFGAKFVPAPNGQALLRQKLTASLALRCLAGQNSELYTGLYADGLLTSDFQADTDYAAGSAVISFAGESAEPDRVLERLQQQVAMVAANGFDPAAFDRARRASYGSRLRGLDYFGNLCFELARSHFGGYRSLEAFALLETVTAEDCAAFVAENLAPDRLAVSLITPSERIN